MNDQGPRKVINLEDRETRFKLVSPSGQEALVPCYTYGAVAYDCALHNFDGSPISYAPGERPKGMFVIIELPVPADDWVFLEDGDGE